MPSRCLLDWPATMTYLPLFRTFKLTFPNPLSDSHKPSWFWLSKLPTFPACLVIRFSIISFSLSDLKYYLMQFCTIISDKPNSSYIKINIHKWFQRVFIDILSISGFRTPFNIYVHSDNQEGSSTPTETMNRGFCLDYVQQPCSVAQG